MTRDNEHRARAPRILCIRGFGGRSLRKDAKTNEGCGQRTQKKGAGRIVKSEPTSKRNAQTILAPQSKGKRSSTYFCSLLTVDCCVTVFFLNWRDITKRRMANNKENF